MLIVEVYSRGFILNWHPQLMDCSTDSLILSCPIVRRIDENAIN